MVVGCGCREAASCWMDGYPTGLSRTSNQFYGHRTPQSVVESFLCNAVLMMVGELEMPLQNQSTN